MEFLFFFQSNLYAHFHRSYCIYSYQEYKNVHCILEYEWMNALEDCLETSISKTVLFIWILNTCTRLAILEILNVHTTFKYTQHSLYNMYETGL